MLTCIPLGLSAQSDTLLIDFGNNISPAPWNNITGPRDGAIDDLMNSAGTLTGFSIAVTDTFNNINTAGTQTPDPSLGFVPTASGDSFFGNVAPFGGREEPTGGVTITNLLTDRDYTFNIFASRPASDNRQTQYMVMGATTEIVTLDVTDNEDMIATATVTPTAAGEIMVIASPGPENDNPSGFYFLGAMQVIYDAIPVIVETDTIIIDMGDRVSEAPINNLANPTTGMIFDLTTMKGNLSGYSLSVTDAFNNINRTGSTNPDPALGFPSTVTEDSFFGSITPFGGREEPTGAVTIEGLNPAEVYTFDIFAARAGATDIREAQYVVSGLGTDTLLLNATDNDSMLVSTTMTPDATGAITITASTGPNNDNGSGFYFMGAVRMVYPEVAPPVVVSIDSVLIDFGDNLTPEPWINITDPQAGSAEDMISKFGIATGIDVTINDAFNNINRTGETNTDASLGLPMTVTADNFFGNVAPFAGQEQPTGGMDFTDLDTSKVYSFSIFASRSNVSDQREAMYTLTGAGIDSMALNASNNTDRKAVINMKPDADGTINLTAKPGPGNDNGSGFYFIGSVILSYDTREPAAPFDTLLVDFGDILSPFPWNNLTDAKVGFIENIPRSDGFLSGYNLTLVDDMNAINRNGVINTDPALGLPSTASQDNFFGNVAPFAGEEQPTGGVLFEGLTADKEYSFEVFASRAATNNRETLYEFVGETTEMSSINAASNADMIATATVKPDAEGNIRVNFMPGPANETASGFYYINAIRVVYPEEDASGDSDVTLTQPTGGEEWQVGRTAKIRWESRNVGLLTLEYSTDDGISWTEIDQVSGGLAVLDWVVPDDVSTTALVRIGDGIVSDMSPVNFTITDDGQRCPIVVLGSSTAAGTGPSSPDSTWVNRFARSLEHSTRFQVINLARGGYTTYNIIPTGTTPDGVTIPIDEDRNINAALALNPFAVIVNMPSNDAANNISVEDQIANFQAISDFGSDDGVDVYITTPQPRNFADQAQIDIQTQLLEAVNTTFGARAIDFWTDIATPEGTVDPVYDSGDGVHVNDAAHAIFFNRVDAVGLGEVDCGLFVSTYEIETKDIGLVIFPNPTVGPVTIQFETESSADIMVSMMDATGRAIHVESYTASHAGVHKIDMNLTNSVGRLSGVVYATIVVDDTQGRRQQTVPVVFK